MDIEGKVILDLPLLEGVSKAGNNWKKKEWVFETFGNYPKKVKIYIFGEDRIAHIPLELGKSYVFSVDIESREYMGRWYTDVNCYGARELGPQEGGGAFGAQPGAPMGAPAPNPFGTAPASQSTAPAPGFPPAGGFGASNDSDDLPF